ncbi:MAG: hypothetical protein VB023_11980 [Oscillibacter sp.]|nr:hypothetical protein [Oscillibacter sp.]
MTVSLIRSAMHTSASVPDTEASFAARLDNSRIMRIVDAIVMASLVVFDCALVLAVPAVVVMGASMKKQGKQDKQIICSLQESPRPA